MKKAIRFALMLAILLSCVGCDQVTKTAAKYYLSSSPAISLFSGLVKFEYAENPGAFMSIGENLPTNVRILVFVFGVGLVIAILMTIMRTYQMNPLEFVGLTLAAGGAIGNLIDRVINHGRVVDFANLGIGSLRTGIFNMADVAILAGVFLFIAGMLWIKRDPASVA